MRILILGPWPVANPRHGGQIRAASIIDAYVLRGHDVRFMGIFDPNNVLAKDHGPDDVGVDVQVTTFMDRNGALPFWSFWLAFAEVPQLFERFASVVREFQPDIVEFEEPYLWPVVRGLRDRGLLGKARVIHSSYNFETELRRDLMKIEGDVDERIMALVAEQEREIAREVDLVVTVSDYDAECFRLIGATSVIIARNGSRRPEARPDALAALDAYLGPQPFALFVSSAHPPNARGMLDMVDGISSSLPAPLLIAGTVCRLLAPERSRHRLLREARLLGLVDKDVLDALVIRAGVIVLPKTWGGGSNLKTSEALLARRPIVGTDFSFAGFEDWKTLPGVSITNEPQAFWSKVSAALNTPQAIPEGGCDEARDQLLWSNCLAAMVTAAEALAIDPPVRAG